MAPARLPTLLSAPCNALRAARALAPAPTHARAVSSSPYGRTHVWKRRPATLPNPVVPQFPQRVVRADGSTFVHWTTSPRSLIRLTRDATNHPLWNPAQLARGEAEEEEGKTTGRLGRFSRRFGDELVGRDDMSWAAEYATETGEAPRSKAPPPAPVKKGKK